PDAFGDVLGLPRGAVPGVAGDGEEPGPVVRLDGPRPVRAQARLAPPRARLAGPPRHLAQADELDPLAARADLPVSPEGVEVRACPLQGLTVGTQAVVEVDADDGVIGREHVADPVDPAVVVAVLQLLVDPDRLLVIGPAPEVVRPGLLRGF